MMSPPLRAQDVFTPGSYPIHTYVHREDVDAGIEGRLHDAIETVGTIVTLSGPSKSGKTVLVERVVGKDNLITITGAGVQRGSDVWDKALDWMAEPTQVTASDVESSKGSGAVDGKTEVSVPLVAKAEVGMSTGYEKSSESRTEAQFGRRGLAQVVNEIAASSFVLLIDDFHYIERVVQEGVAEELKEAARQKVRIVIAAVPHRSDDVIRALSDLRGRVTSLRMSYWGLSDLIQIGRLGFQALNLEVDEESLEEFAREAAGSPQLMQAICLDACREIDHRVRTNQPRSMVIPSEQKRRIYERTVSSTDHRTLVDILLEGPKRRGTERRVFSFASGASGDTYRCVLRAIAADPPKQFLTYKEINARIETICAGQAPSGSAVSGACGQMAKHAGDYLPSQRALDWDNKRGVLDIPDPYLLFYLRWSGHV